VNKREDTFQGMVTDILQPKIDAYSSGDQYVEEPHVDIETFVNYSAF